MPTNFPTSLDNFTNPSSGDAMNSVTVPHAEQHANANDAIEALEAKVGINNSGVTSSLDYLLRNSASINPGHLHTIVATQLGATGLYFLDGGEPFFGSLSVPGRAIYVGSSGELTYSTNFRFNDVSNTFFATNVSGTWAGATIGIAQGGTNLTSYASGDILYGANGSLSKLAIGTSGFVLKSDGVAPVWAAESVGGSLSGGGAASGIAVWTSATAVTSFTALRYLSNVNTLVAPTLSGTTVLGGTVSGFTFNASTFSTGSITATDITSTNLSGGTYRGTTLIGNTVSGGTFTGTSASALHVLATNVTGTIVMAASALRFGNSTEHITRTAANTLLLPHQLVFGTGASGAIGIGTTSVDPLTYGIYAYKTQTIPTSGTSVRTIAGFLEIANGNGGSFPYGLLGQTTINSGASAVGWAGGLYGSCRDQASQSGAVTTQFGFGCDAWKSGTGNTTTLAGFTGNVVVRPGASGVVTNAQGMDATVSIEAGSRTNFTTARGLYLYLSHLGSGDITNWYGLHLYSNMAGGSGTISNYRGIYLRQPDGSGPTMTNSYGIYLEEFSKGTTSAAIYLAGTGGQRYNGISWNADTYLYRSAAAVLRTDGSFSIGASATISSGSLTLSATGTNTGIRIGNDIRMYRSTAPSSLFMENSIEVATGRLLKFNIATAGNTIVNFSDMSSLTFYPSGGGLQYSPWPIDNLTNTKYGLLMQQDVYPAGNFASPSSVYGTKTTLNLTDSNAYSVSGTMYASHTTFSQSHYGTNSFLLNYYGNFIKGEFYDDFGNGGSGGRLSNAVGQRIELDTMASGARVASAYGLIISFESMETTVTGAVRKAIYIPGMTGSGSMSNTDISAIHVAGTGIINAIKLNDTNIFSTGASALTIENSVAIGRRITSAVVTITSGASSNTNAALGNHFRLTLGGNSMLMNPTNALDGQKITWEIIQDFTGGRTLSYDSKFGFGSDITSATLSTSGLKRDFLTAIYNSSTDKFYVTGFVKGY